MLKNLFSWKQFRLLAGVSIFILCSASNCLSPSLNTLRAFKDVNIYVTPDHQLVKNDSVAFQVVIEYPHLWLNKNHQMDIAILVDFEGDHYVLGTHRVKPPVQKKDPDYKIVIDVAAPMDMDFTKGYSEVYLQPRITNKKNGNYKELIEIPVSRVYTSREVFEQHRQQLDQGGTDDYPD